MGSKKKKGKPSALKKYFLLLLYLFLFALLLKSFFLNAYRIPTGSMEPTLLPGDHIIVNKAAYALSTPHQLPLTNINLPVYEFLSFKKPGMNDIVVFKIPLDPNLKSEYIKRIVALPGDTIQIKDNIVFTNGKEKKYAGISDIDSLPKKRNKYIDKRIFNSGDGWSMENFGPLVIPARGFNIELNHKNVEFWKPLINKDLKRKAVSVEGTVIMIDKKPAREYIFKNDFYFLLGDNRDNSIDSCFFGPVPAYSIIGTASFIYLSWKPSFSNDNFFRFYKKIRGDRLFKPVR